MIARTFDAAALDAVFKHPAVEVAFTVPTGDFAPVLADLSVIALTVPGGAFLLHPIGAGLQAHVGFLPGHRGIAALRWGLAAMAWVWRETSAARIVLHIRADNAPARGYATRLGFDRLSRHAAKWPDGLIRDTAFYRAERPA